MITFECIAAPNFTASFQARILFQVPVEEASDPALVRQYAEAELARRQLACLTGEPVASGINNKREEWYQAFPNQRLWDEWNNMVEGHACRYMFADDPVFQERDKTAKPSWKTRWPFKRIFANEQPVA